MTATLTAATRRALLDGLGTCYDPARGELPGEAPVWVSLVRNGTAGQALSIRAIATLVEMHLGTAKVQALRHTFATGMEESGTKVSAIQARLGHERLATTGKYLSALKRAENPQADALARVLGRDAAE